MTHTAELGMNPSPDITLGEAARIHLLRNPHDGGATADQAADVADIEGVEDSADYVGPPVSDGDVEMTASEGVPGDDVDNTTDGCMPIDGAAPVRPEETGGVAAASPERATSENPTDHSQAGFAAPRILSIHPTGEEGASEGEHSSTAANSDDPLQAYIDETGLRACIESGSVLQQADRGALECLYQHLANVYRVAADPRLNLQRLAEVCARFEVPCTAATLDNPHIAIIKICVRGIDMKRASLQATALKFARLNQVHPDNLVAFLRENGGVQGCVEQLREMLQPEAEGGGGSARRAASAAGRQRDGLLVRGAHAAPDGRYMLAVDIVGGEAVLVGEMQPQSQDTRH